MTTLSAATPKIKFQWRVFALIAVLNLVASPLILPYTLALTPITVDAMQGFYAILLVQQVCSVLILNIPLAALGLLLGNRIGFGAPILTAWLKGKRSPQPVVRIFGLSLIFGALSGVLILLLLQVLAPLVASDLQSRGFSMPQISMPSAWQGFLASISAGITEETLLRLFLLTLLAWLGSRIRRTSTGYPKPLVFWGANLLAGFVFGVLHLPLASSLMPLTPWVVIQVLSLNSLAGLVFGWLYWKYGLESAMLAHFSTDMVLHVIAPLMGVG